MSANLLSPDDLHQQLRERAVKNRSTVDEFAVFLMRSAMGAEPQDYAIRQDGRFACFDLPKNAPLLDMDKIQAAIHD